MLRPTRTALLALAALLAAPAALPAGWESIGALPPAAEKTAIGLVHRDRGVAVSVTALSPEVVRVRYSPTRSFGRDHSYAVVDRDLGPARAVVTPGPPASEIVTPALRVRLTLDPFRIAFFDADGESLEEDDPVRGMAHAGGEVRVWKRLRDDEVVYGFGEKNGRLDKRGWSLGGYHYTMWNTDTYACDSSTDPTYVSVPFFIVMRGGKAHGIFLDREKRVPADTLWLDIDYQRDFKPFTWDGGRFPDPGKMIADLRAQGFRVVTIVDPHPTKEPGYRIYDEGIAGAHFVKNADGTIFEGPVWPSNAARNPGNSVFPDFTRAATREWWGGLYREFLDLGVAGIWNDMNEPAVWIRPADSMPLDVRHDNDGFPEIYDAMEEASRTGIPAMRPMFLEFPEDPQTWSRDDQLFFGPDLLVAPVLREGVVSREVYLPAGEWFDFWTGAPVAGGRTLRVPVTIDSLPIYVRAGAFVFRQPVVQHTGQMPGQPLLVHVYPSATSAASFYEDDGETMAYRRGESARRRFAQRRENGRVTIEAAAVEGRYRPAARDLVFTVVGEAVASRVEVDGRTLARVEPPAFDAAGTGWTARDGSVAVKVRDRPEALRLTIER